jgi:hypothetical protein
MSELITPEEFINAKEFIKDLNAIEKSLSNLLVTIGKYGDINKKAFEEVKKGATTQKELIKNQELANKTTKDTIALEKEQERIEKELAKTKAKIALATSEQNKQLVEEKKRLKDVNDQVNGVTDAEKKRKANIGKYKEDIVKAYVAINAVLLVAKAAYNAVNNAIKENETTAEFLERKIGGLGAAFGVLKAKVFEAAESLISSNDKSINWGNGLRNVISAITMGFSELIPGVRKVGDEMNQASKEAEKLIKTQQDLADLEGDRILKRSESNRQLVEARDLYNDETKSLTEKRDLLKSAIELENTQLDEEITYQSQVVANLIAQGELKKRLKTFDVGREGLAIKQAEAKLNDLVTESLTRQRKAKANLRAIDKQISDEAIGKFSDANGNTWKTSLDQWGSDWDKSTEDIEKKGEDSLKKMNSDIEKYNEEKVKSDKEAQDSIDAKDEENHKKFLRRQDEKKQAAEDLRDLQIDVANAVFDLGAAFNSREIAELESKKDKEIKAAGDNAKKKEKIEAEYQKKIGALRRRQAIIDKVQALFNIGLNTAIGVTNALSKVVTIPLVPWIKLLGGLQAAAVLATPLPKFFKGVKDFKGGPAVVGEKGMELVETPKGSFLTPEKATTMLLPEHSTVHTHEKTIEKLKEMDGSKVNELIKEQRLTRKALANQVHHSTKIDERGARFLTHYGNSTTEWINKNFR